MYFNHSLPFPHFFRFVLLNFDRNIRYPIIDPFWTSTRALYPNVNNLNLYDIWARGYPI